MADTIFVINPNSSDFATERIDAAIAPLRLGGGPALVCLKLDGGPAGIQSQIDSDAVIVPLLRRAAELEKEASAFVIAAFGDPGLHALREQSAHPVLGISECGIMTALTIGERFGVLCLQPASIPRHLRYFRMLGVDGRLAADLPLGLNVTDLADEGRMAQRIIEVGRVLRDDHGADVIVLGGAPMSPARERLEDALGLPVVDPNQAAVGMAIGRVLTRRPAPASIG